MSQSASADQISFLLAGYVLGTLDAAEAEAFAQLVVEEPALIEKIDQMQQALEEAYNLPELAPPPQLREKVLAAAIASENSTVLEPARLTPAIPSIVHPSLSANQSPRHLKAIAIALFTALGLSAFCNLILWRQLRQQIASPPDLPQQEQTVRPVAYTLSTIEPSTSGNVEVVINKSTLTAELKATQLPPLAPDETYVLWTVLQSEAPYTADEKGAILTIAFQVDDQGIARETLAIPAAFRQPELVKAIAITVESAAAPQKHTGSPILLSPI